MILIDVNVLVYAHRTDAANHSRFRQWLESVVNADATYGMSELVLSSFLRIVTHPRVFRQPSPIESALAFAEEVKSRPNCLLVHPGERHWGIFNNLCNSVGARGNLISDAYLAALAIELGAEWITTDRDYARFPGLRWRHPLH